MSKSGREKRLSYSSFRRRKQLTANDRRFCIIWINRMVNKQVEKRVAKLHTEFFLMNHALREEMVVELQEQLRELVAERGRERSLLYNQLDGQQRITSRWLRDMEEEDKENTEAEEEFEAKSMDLETLSLNFSKTPSDTNSIFTMRNTPKCGLEESSKMLLDVSSDCDSSGISNQSDTSLKQAKCEQEDNKQILSDVTTIADNRQSTKNSGEEESPRNPFLENSCFTTKELICEEDLVRVRGTKEEEAFLMEKQWKEWMDNREMRGKTHKKVKPVAQQNTEKQEGAPVSVKNIEQNGRGVDTMAKVKTYLIDLFHPHISYKWERLDDED